MNLHTVLISAINRLPDTTRADHYLRRTDDRTRTSLDVPARHRSDPRQHVFADGLTAQSATLRRDCR
jgi:hypothetical protein